jgi:hypothetical protein
MENALKFPRLGHGLTEKKKETLLSAIYIGSVLIVLAAVFIASLPNNLFDQLINFFLKLTLAPVPGTGGIALPAPSNPAAHVPLYMAAFEFTLGVGIAEIIILVLRVMLDSPVQRKAETVENIVYWLGTSYLVVVYLVNMTIAGEWFVFWAGIILIFGLALLARSFVLLAQRI